MTIESKEIIIEMLKNDGIYGHGKDRDPQASSIYSYIGMNEKRLFAVFMDERWNDIYTSPYVHNPILLWDRVSGRTRAGRELIMEEMKGIEGMKDVQ